MSHRKDYNPLPDSKLDRLKADSQAILGSPFAQLSLPAQTIYWMVMELIDSREEIFRLQLCETVDQILADELDDDEEDLLALRWPDDYCIGDDAISGAYIPAFPCKETGRLPTTMVREDKPSDHDGRRIPRVE